MKYLTMNKKEREQVKIFEQIKGQKITQATGAKILQITPSWISKKMKRYSINGDFGIIHRSRGKQSPLQWKSEEKLFLLNLLQSDWKGFGPTFASEKLEEKHGIKISKETARKAMIEANIWQPNINRFKHRSRRERKSVFGIMVQADGSPHAWFEDRAEKCTLLVLIDDATSQILWLEFALSESRQSLMQATKNYVEKYGAPQVFYTDHGSVFHVQTNNKNGDKKTDWELTVKQLGSEVIHANSPQAKGRVERCNRTMQDRLIKELRLEKISSIEDANNYLRSSDFIAKHNEKYAVEALENGDAHQSTEGLDLHNIFSFKETRILKNDYTVEYLGKTYQLAKKQNTIIRPKNAIIIQIDLYEKITLWRENIQLKFDIFYARPRLIIAKAPKERKSLDVFQKPSLQSKKWVNR